MSGYESVVIERTDGAAPTFLCEKIGRDFGSPLGGWTADRAQATPYSREHAERLLVGPLAHIAPNCKLEPQSSINRSANGDPHQ